MADWSFGKVAIESYKEAKRLQEQKREFDIQQAYNNRQLSLLESFRQKRLQVEDENADLTRDETILHNRNVERTNQGILHLNQTSQWTNWKSLTDSQRVQFENSTRTGKDINQRSVALGLKPSLNAEDKYVPNWAIDAKERRSLAWLSGGGNKQIPPQYRVGVDGYEEVSFDGGVTYIKSNLQTKHVTDLANAIGEMGSLMTNYDRLNYVDQAVANKTARFYLDFALTNSKLPEKGETIKNLKKGLGAEEIMDRTGLTNAEKKRLIKDKWTRQVQDLEKQGAISTEQHNVLDKFIDVQLLDMPQQTKSADFWLRENK